jgi:hypothetical protein
MLGSLPIAARLAALAAAMAIAGSSSAAAQGPAATASLGLDSSPPEALLYLHGPDGPRLAALCTGSCELQVAPGTYRLAAGFSHARLTDARAELRLAPGERTELNVTVRENGIARRLMGAALLVDALCLGTFGALAADRGFQSVPVTPATRVGAASCLAVTLAAALFIAPAMLRPVVETRRWTIPTQEDGS